MNDNLVTTMEEWVSDYEYMNWGRGTRHSPYPLGGRNVDKAIRICPHCKNLWETFYMPRGMRLEYYTKGSLPKLGKSEKTCPKCKSKGKDNE